MLRLFRNIRQKLMEQNKVRTYLLYAVGEILLVMVGILLALQVNNWNEERKLIDEEQYLLEELRKEFSTNLERIKRDYQGNDRTQSAIISIMDLFDTSNKEVEVTLDSLIVEVFTSTSFDATTGVVDEIIGTGRLRVLRDDSLRYLISQWPSIVDDQQEDIEISWTHFEQFLFPEISRTFPIKNTNRFFNFSFWSDTYKRVDLPRSKFEFKPELFFTPEMEGLLYVHSLNQDFILMNDVETEKYIIQILDRISDNEN